jgi:Flp pilus assembly protein TadG
MFRLQSSEQGERGATLFEFALVATIFLTSIFAVLEFGRLYWTHNALRDAARRGARYAIVRKNDAASILAVQKMVVYGDPNANPATAKPLVSGLTTANVTVTYKNFDGILLSAQATVNIINYQYKFIVPLVGTTINMPAYRTTLPGESAGFVPCDISDPAPYKPCNIIPL